MTEVAGAYADGAAAWAAGPARVYRPLADALVAFSPEPLSGKVVLDSGSGTGVGSRAAAAAGARSVVASDIAHEMLLVDRAHRPPAAAGDAVALPFRDRAFDVVLAPFSLNHLPDPAVGVREAGRVANALLASTYAVDDDHPAKAAADRALVDAGWVSPDWYGGVKRAMQSWGTVELATDAIERGGLDPVRVEKIHVRFDELTADDLIAWRFGLAHIAPFVTSLDAPARARLRARTLELLGPDPEPLVRRVIFFAAARAA